MSYEYSEDGLVEAASQEVLENLGWQVEMAWHHQAVCLRLHPARSHGCGHSAWQHTWLYQP